MRVFILLSSLLTCSSIHAETHYVCSEPGFETESNRYNILKQIVESEAVDGDTVKICHAYIPMYGQITVTKDITIDGAGEVTWLRAEPGYSDSTMFLLAADGITLQNVKIDGYNIATRGIKVQQDSNTVRIQDNVITRFKGTPRPINSSTLPARAIFFDWNVKDSVIQRNTISEVSGHEIDADAAMWNTTGKIAHRGIYARNAENLVIYQNTIENIYGHIDGDSIHIYDNTCDSSRADNRIIQNTINQFGKRAIKIQGGNVEVLNNTISSNGDKEFNVGPTEVGISFSGIGTYRGNGCTASNQPPVLIDRNEINLKRATAGILIQAEGMYGSSESHSWYGNDITIESAQTGRFGRPSAAIKVLEDAVTLVYADILNNTLSHPTQPFCYWSGSVPVGNVADECESNWPAHINYQP